MLVVEGIEEGFMIDCEALAGARCLRISRSSKSSETSLISPSDGSLSDTSSMRACDMVAAVVRRGLSSRRGEVDGGVWRR